MDNFFTGILSYLKTDAMAAWVQAIASVAAIWFSGQMSRKSFEDSQQAERNRRDEQAKENLERIIAATATTRELIHDAQARALIQGMSNSEIDTFLAELAFMKAQFSKANIFDLPGDFVRIVVKISNHIDDTITVATPRSIPDIASKTPAIVGLLDMRAKEMRDILKAKFPS